MMLALLLSLLPAITQAPPDGPSPITVKLNHEQFSRGDHAKVYVQAARDGYLVVLHADPEGRVRVLFPLDPTDDAFVRGGKRQELRGRSNRDAFLVDGDGGEDGAGTVLAAVSSDPFTYDGFVLNGHWDYRSLGQGSVKDDPLAGLLDIVRKMSGQDPFEYDAANYIVGGGIAARYGYGYGSGYGYPTHVRIGVSFGHRFGYPYDPFYDPFCFDPFWSWSARCYGSGFGFGYGVYDRPFFGGGFANRGGSRFVIPRNRDRFTPIEVRPRSGSVSPRSRSFGGQPSIAPRDRGGKGWSGGGRSDGGRPSVSRGGGAVSRPAARPSGGRGGSSGGGRRH